MIPSVVLESIPLSQRTCVIDALSPQKFNFKAVSGGFSRNRVWHLRLADPPYEPQYAIHFWNDHTYSLQQLKDIFSFQKILKDNQTVVPEPKRWLNNEFVISGEGGFWTIEEWLPGESLDGIEAVSDELLDQVVACISALHRAGREIGVTTRRSIGIQERIDRVERLKSKVADHTPGDLMQYFFDTPNIESIKIGFETAYRLVRDQASTWVRLLNLIQDLPPECHWVMRDLWRENILIAHGRISGIIDFGASRIDWPILELVRCASSFLLPNDPRWQSFLDSYALNLPTKESVSLELVLQLDQVATALSLAYWYEQLKNAKTDPDMQLKPQAWSRIDELSIRIRSF
ncbi:MAG: aminoglycoside phosphotransferase family protein [Planctomycetota bacterium]|nr:aminoglycoside phosphotransferase family protein [Planctomycetota bacterium]